MILLGGDFLKIINKVVNTVIYLLIFIMILNVGRWLIKVVGIDMLDANTTLYDSIYADDLYLRTMIGKHFDTEGNTFNTNWKEVYPFMDKQTGEILADNTSKSKNDEINDVTFSYFYDDGFIFNEAFVSVGNSLKRKIGINNDLSSVVYSAENNNNKNNTKKENDTSNLVELDNGYYVNLMENRDCSYVLDKLTNFNSYLEEKNIELIYVQAPGKISREMEKEIKTMYNDNSNDLSDELLDRLNQNNVDTLDLRPTFEADNYTSLFYMTDHHWNMYGTVLASKTIVDKLTKGNYDNKIYDINNYDIDRYEKAYVGAYGTQLALPVNEFGENLDVLIPKGKTSLNIYIPEVELNVDGTFADIVDKSIIEEHYSVAQMYYIYYNCCFNRIINNKATNDHRVLLLGDSFNSTLYPYLALGVKELLFVDNRGFDGSIETLIEDYKPDTVIVLNTTSSIVDPEVSEENITLWDFR